MRRTATTYAALLVAFVMTAAIAGCGSGNKEGSNQSASPLFGNVATVGDTTCIQCHSANTEALTGQTLVAQYQQNSPHNQDGLGCESCHGGGAQHNGVGPIPFPLAGLSPTQQAQRCATCHNGVQTLTVNGVATVAPATNSFSSFSSSNHATGTPSHTSGLCIRCHTNEGAVLSNLSGFTGDATVLGNAAFGPPVVTSGFTAFTCETCHQHGAGLRGIEARDATGNLVLWNPDKQNKTDQFNLCTSCHNLYNYNQTKVIASGSAASSTLTYAGHNTRWNRIPVTTHKEKGMASLLTLPFANMTSAADASNTWITGYVIRLTKPTTSATTVAGVNYNTDPNYKGPCFDCHGHEAKTNTSNNPYLSTFDPTQTTIYTDWAQSAHAGGILQAKYSTAKANLRTAAEVDSVIQAYTDTTTSVWSHYNWDSTLTAAGADDRGSCQMCHTATGLSNYLDTQNTALTGYNPVQNNFSHLLGWNQKGGSKRQNELLYCWGCHKDAGTGALRKTDQAILSFTLNSQPIVIAGTGKSTACVVCHGGRGSAGEAAATDQRSSRFNGHHAATAGILYSAQTHIGYEYAGQNYANPSFFAHDKIGLNAAGPCASCHMAPSVSDGKPSHTFQPVTTDPTTGVITAINNQALCNTCHTPGGQFAMTPAILEEESDGYAQASTILNNYVANVTGYTNYLGLAITGSNYNNTTLVPNNAYGAYQNGKIGGTLGGTFGTTVIAPANGDEPCAYVHNRFYIKRLIFDSIDWMDNGVLNGTISIDATTYPAAAAWFNASGTTGTVTATRP